MEREGLLHVILGLRMSGRLARLEREDTCQLLRDTDVPPAGPLLFFIKKHSSGFLGSKFIQKIDKIAKCNY